jgi:uncharacterized protein (TIGR03000 family)
MYSAVLMLALTAGNDSVDFGRNRCNGGCSSGSVCSGAVYGGCSASHCSSRGGLFSHRSHGCSGSSGCSSTVAVGCSSGCSSRGHGCHGGGLFSGGGGLFHRNRCSGACSGSVCSGAVVGCSSGCTGGTVVPPTTKPMPKSEPVPPPKKTAVSAPATIVVNLPADARLIVDGAQTTSTSDRRTLVTPELAFGATYVYTFQAEIVREGRTMAQTQQVSVRGGDVSTVRFDFSTQPVASR